MQIIPIRSIISGMIFNLILGSYYVYGNINDYAASYLKTDPKTTLFVPSIWLFVQSFAAMLSIRLAEKLGYRVL
jgi:hypothetical protein